MRRSLLLALAGLLVVGLVSVARPSVAAPEPDDRVTPATDYVRHDGGSDRAIQHCSDTSTSTAPDIPNDGDTDSNDGGAFRQGNEPTVAIDPTNPDLVVAGWNDYCDSDLGGGWMGIAFSGDRGETWTPSKIPGYPSDTSVEGAASPLHNRQAEAGDPLLAFDNDGNLFAGGIAFNRVNPQNGDVWVATYASNPHPSGYPKDYLRTVVVGQGTPGLAGIFEDKPELEVDRTGGRFDGNVYICWSRFVGANGRTQISFSRSTDSGQTFSHPILLSDGKDVQGCDIAIEADGDVYVTWGTGTPRRRSTRRASRSPGQPTAARASSRPNRSRPSPGTSRPTARATAATARPPARAGSCSSGCRSSRGSPPTRAASCPASSPPTTRSTRPPWYQVPPPIARPGRTPAWSAGRWST